MENLSELTGSADVVLEFVALSDYATADVFFLRRHVERVQYR
jgi:hypothetical protein